MMSRRTVQLENRTILFSPDDPVPLVDRIQALVKLRVTDELTGSPPDRQITIDVRERGFRFACGKRWVGWIGRYPAAGFSRLCKTRIISFT